MTEHITLTVEGASVEAEITGTPERIIVTDQAPDHGRMAGLADDDHPQYVIAVIAAERPTNPRPGTMWIPSG